MKATIKSITLNHFRKYENETFTFEPGENTIEKPNMEGKSSLATAVSWVLYGKDLFGASQFEVESNFIPDPKTNVTIVIDVDGKEVVLSKSPGKWSFDKLEVKKNVFEDLLTQSINAPSVLELLSNPFAFTNLHWEVQRNMLTKMFSEKVPEDSEFSFLMKSMPISEIKKTKTKAKKEANDGLVRSNIIIETYEKQITECMTIDFLKLKNELSTKKKELEILSNFDWELYYKKQSKVKTLQFEYDSLVKLWKEKEAEVKAAEVKKYEDFKGCLKCGTKVSQEAWNKLKTDHLILAKTQRENLKNEILEKRKLVDPAKADFDKMDATKPDATTTVIIEELKRGIEFLNKELVKENNIVSLNEKMQEEQTRLDQFTNEIMQIEAFLDRFGTFLKDNYYKSINENFDGLFWDIENECKLTNASGTEFKYFSLSEKINAGVQIISVLSKKLEIQFPLWIDNRESVTNLYPIDTQVINLKVKE